MSFDPYGGYTPDRPPDQPPAQPPPGQTTGGPSVPGGPAPAAALVRERVLMPAIFLVIVGVLNLFMSFGMGFVGLGVSSVPPEKLEAEMQKDGKNAAQLKQLKEMGYSMQDIMNIYRYGGVGGGAVVLLLSLLIIAGGVCMMRLRGYGLSVFAALVAAVPCLSPMSCPCLGIGLAVGLWSLVVLMAADVRAAFQ